MKNVFSIIIISLLASCVLFSCKDDITGVGSSVQPDGDKIMMKADVIESIVLQTQIVDSVFIKQDSLLLGSFSDNTFGTANADILAQLMPPLDFTFPRDEDGNIRSEVDSVRLEIYYSSWVGNGNAIMRIRAYELNQAIFTYNEQYPSNINVADYCDLSQPLGDAVITPNKGNLGAKNIISIKLPEDFAKHRFNPNDANLYPGRSDETTYNSVSNFLNFFKGLYITTDFGSTAMLNVSSITLNYYYHYMGRDGVPVVLPLPFAANREVVRVNRIEHPNRAQVVIPDSMTYISSPANFYTKVSVPLKEIYEQMNNAVGDKILTISTARFEVDAKNVANTDYFKMPSTLLAVKESAYNRFFANRELPTANDTCATYGNYTRTAVVDSDTTYTYAFDLSRLVATEFHNAKIQGTMPADTLTLMLLPVSLSGSSTYITGATHYLPISGVALKKKAHLKVLYNGF
jgi:predicted small secreted protein